MNDDKNVLIDDGALVLTFGERNVCVGD